MSINYITKHEGQFEKRLMQGSLTAILETPKVNWLGAKSFELPTISVTGYKAHTRSKGYNSGTVSNDKNVYTLGFDRDVEFFVDTADVDETNQELSAANISNTFISEHATPEVDAYRFSKIATAAINGHHFKLATVFHQFLKAICHKLHLKLTTLLHGINLIFFDIFLHLLPPMLIYVKRKPHLLEISRQTNHDTNGFGIDIHHPLCVAQEQRDR